jgi:hypothetical protein
MLTINLSIGHARMIIVGAQSERGRVRFVRPRSHKYWCALAALRHPRVSGSNGGQLVGQ